MRHNLMTENQNNHFPRKRGCNIIWTSLSIKVWGIEMFTIHIQANTSTSGLHFLQVFV